MNTWKMEWRLLRGSLLTWIISVGMLLGIFLSFYPAFMREIDSLLAAFQSMPKELLKGLGFDLASFRLFSGYLGYVYSFALLLLAIMAMNSGLLVIGREKKHKMSDFLLSKPRTRIHLALQKIAAGLSNILIINLFIVLLCLLVAGLQKSTLDRATWQIIVGGMMIQLMFFFIGTFYAAVRKRLKNIVSISTGITLLFYFILVIARILENQEMKLATPFGYFDPADIVTTGIKSSHFLISLGMILLLFAATLWVYDTQDAEV